MGSTANSLILSYEDAARRVREYAASVPRPRVETVRLLESLGRVLAQPVLADRDQPPFARSTRDGFACRAADLAEPKPLRMMGRLQAGEAWSGAALAPGEAIEIMTGAPVPAGADCVLMVEHAVVEGGHVTPSRTLVSGDNVVPTGAEARAGAVLIEPGTRIAPQHIAATAACGYETLEVYVRPRVAIFATGDELVPISAQPLPYQIRNSNSYTVAAQAAHAGAIPVVHPAVRDSLEESKAAIASALDCDLLIFSGGVSMGKYDFVEQALATHHAEFFFTGARIRPGSPVVFGQIPTPSGGHLPFFGLPGNPVSTLVTFALFAAPLASALGGQATIGPTFAQARLAHDVKPHPHLTRFLPAVLESSATEATVHTVAWQGSGDQSAAAKTNCFLVSLEGKHLIAGDTATFLLL